MGKGLSYRLPGQCVNDGANSGLYFFKTVNMHMVWSSPTCSTQMESGFFACGSDPLLVPPKAGTEKYPPNFIPTSDSVVFGRPYGKSFTTPTELTALNGDPVYFSQNDIAPWKPTTYCPPPLNRYSRAGPAYNNCHLYGAMNRRKANNNNYTNRADYNFIDGFEVPYADYKEKLCGTGCPTQNWLIFSNPAQPLFTTVNEPFTISTHFEQCGQPCPSDPNNGGNLYVPFCAPMRARKENGDVIGEYTGLAVSAVFGMCSLAYGFARPYLPPNEWDPSTPPKPRVDSGRAFYSIEVSVYFTGNSTDPSYLLGSPLLGKYRYYLYSAPQNQKWKYPFRVLFQDTIYASNPMQIICNVINEGPLTFTLNASNQKVLVTY